MQPPMHLKPGKSNANLVPPKPDPSKPRKCATLQGLEKISPRAQDAVSDRDKQTHSPPDRSLILAPQMPHQCALFLFLHHLRTHHLRSCPFLMCSLLIDFPAHHHCSVLQRT
ncbi:hypothetical protein M758_2G228800, partial [Ceratodon purpureus]